MAKLEFYFGPGACSLATHIALEECGAKFEARPIALRKGQQFTPEYTALNPKNKVPLLVIDGKPLTENVAIITWLSKAYPAARLLPAGDPMKEAEALAMLAWCTAGIHPIFSRMFGPQKVCDVPDTADSIKRLAAEITAKNFALIDSMLEGKDFILGDFSAVDGYLVVFWRWALFHKLDLAPYKNYAKHFERMNQRPGVQRALAREAEASAAFEKAA